jgi:hypothetical protein
VQEELDFALEIFKAGYQKRKFEGPYVTPALTRSMIERRPVPSCVDVASGTLLRCELSTTSSNRPA